jgi:hypothetical protein
MLRFVVAMAIHQMTEAEAGGALDVLAPYLLGPGADHDPLDLGRLNSLR